jgi:hypothetical protein
VGSNPWEAFINGYGWYYTLLQICGDNAFMLEKLGKWTYIEMLTYLQYMKQKGEIELFIQQSKGER